MSPSSSHRVIVSSAERRFCIQSIDEEGGYLALLTIGKFGTSKTTALMIVSRISQTTDVRLVGMNCLGYVVRGLLFTNVQGPWQFEVKV